MKEIYGHAAADLNDSSWKNAGHNLREKKK
jgi:hypothetical protein